MLEYIYIESPELGISKCGYPKENVSDIHCPIDNLPLIIHEDSYEVTSWRSCPGCKCNYGVTDNPEALKQIAQRYLEQLKREISEKKTELSKLEKIIILGKKKGIIY